MRRFVFTVCVALTCFGAGCSEEKTEANVPTVHAYSGSASKGDLVTFDVNQTDHAYTIRNETSGFESSGTFAALNVSGLPGVQKISVADPTAGALSAYAVELGGDLLVTNVPIDNLSGGQHFLSFGVSQLFDNTGKESQIAGDYVWIRGWYGSINGNSKNKEWGLLRVDANGQWEKKNFATGGTGSLPAADPGTAATYGNTSVVAAGFGDETGSWSVNGSNKERLTVTIDGVSGVTLTGFVYVAGDSGQAAFLLDLGIGQGFMLALKQPAIGSPITMAQVAGTYSFVDLWYGGNNAWPGAGSYTLAAGGDGSYQHVDAKGVQVGGVLPAPVACSPLRNMFVSNGISIDVNGNGTLEAGETGAFHIYLVVIADVIMHLTFEDGAGLVSYGFGSRQ